MEAAHRKEVPGRPGISLDDVAWQLLTKLEAAHLLMFIPLHHA